MRASPPRRALAATAVVVACIAGVGPRPALADGDPASDYLLTEKVFAPFDLKNSATLEQQLAALAFEASKKGYQIRIALIATRYDLGAVTALWKRPQTYAHFLAQELSFFYRGRVLIVMPNGFGIYRLNRSTATERRVLAKLTVGPGGEGLARSAVTAVQRLAAADGVRLSPPHVTSPSAKNSYDRLTIAVAVGAVLVALTAARLLVPRLRREGRR